MENFYLVKWLKENGGLAPELVEALKYELDKRIYYYGGQFAYPQERSFFAGKYRGLKTMVKSAASRLKPGAARGGKAGTRVSSNAYFNLDEALEGLGCAVDRAPWELSRKELGDEDLYARINALKRVFESGDFKTLIAPGFLRKLVEFKAVLKAYYAARDYLALVVPFDLPFFERAALGAFKELGRPSFVALHGLPGRYNAQDDNKADYLLVWGEKIRDCYVKAGVNENKIFVTGRPGSYAAHAGAPRFSTEDVLVVSKSMNGSQHSAEEILSDRGNLVLYLYSVRRALERAGVKKARLRLHPSESAAWYRGFIDGSFFTFDRAPLDASLARATLAVGPTSTVFVEALLRGVNYLVYEPLADGRDLTNYPAVPPFDGSDPKVPAAHTEEDLFRLLSGRKAAAPGAVSAYVKTPFDLSAIVPLLARK